MVPLPSESGAASERAATCVEAEAWIRRFASGSLPSEERVRLREHSESCEACRSHYDDVVATLARLGHERRITRVAREKYERRASLRRDVFEAQRSKRFDRGRLRALAYPALIALLFVALGQRMLSPVGAQVLAQGPEVWLRGQVLRPDHGKAALRVGERLATGLGGSASIAWQDTLWKLNERSEVRLEAFRPLSLRVLEGRVEVNGPFVGYLPVGLVRGGPDSRVTLSGQGAQWSIEVLQGEATWVAAEGERVLSAGTRWQP